MKLFSPYNGWRWYITEWDPETGLCFGLVEGFEIRTRILRPLTELAEVTVFGSVPAVERDLYWEPMTLGEIRRESSRDSGLLISGSYDGNQREIKRKERTMPEENGMKATRSDAPERRRESLRRCGGRRGC